MSSKKLLEQCQKLEKLWGHVLTGKYFYLGKQKLQHSTGLFLEIQVSS